MSVSPTLTAGEPLLVDPRTAAKLLAISPRTLWSLTKCGEIPYRKIGRLVRYNRRDLLTFADAGNRSIGVR